MRKKELKNEAIIVVGSAIGLWWLENMTLGLVIGGIQIAFFLIMEISIRADKRVAETTKNIYDNLLDQGTQMRTDKGDLWTKETQIDHQTGKWIKPNA